MLYRYLACELRWEDLLEWLIGIVVVIAMVVWWGRRQVNKPGILNARVLIPATGAHRVEFGGRETDDNLSLLALVYGAKIRWLLNNEPEEANQLFKILVREAVDAWGEHSEGDLVAAMPTAKELVEQPRETNAAGGEEEYIVRFHRRPSGEGYVINTLPRPCLSFNIPWHYILLLSAIEPKLSPETQGELKVALGAATTQWEMENGTDMSSLKQMTTKSNRVFKPA